MSIKIASADTLCKKLLNVKRPVVESHSFYNDANGVPHLRIKARPNAWHQDECPFCGDPFHVVEWAMDALDEVRKDRWRAAYEKAKELATENPQKRGRPKADDETIAKVQNAKAKASEIKNSGYTLGKAPEHLTENQRIRLDMIPANDPLLYKLTA